MNSVSLEMPTTGIDLSSALRLISRSTEFVGTDRAEIARVNRQNNRQLSEQRLERVLPKLPRPVAVFGTQPGQTKRRRFRPFREHNSRSTGAVITVRGRSEDPTARFTSGGEGLSPFGLEVVHRQRGHRREPRGRLINTLPLHGEPLPPRCEKGVLA